MPAISIKIDRASIEAKIRAAIEKQGGAVAEEVARKVFKRAYKAMLRDFDQHPITAELRAGSRAVNFSDTLGGYGNLYSFLGFEVGSNPTGPLRDMLELGTNMRMTLFRNNTWYFKVQTPSKAAIEAVTPMEWESGNSWAYAIEDGVSNLSHYLYKNTSKSRSGTGIQEEGWEINEDLEFKRTKYLSEIFENFRNRINNN
jgi:hypothetical protein